MGQKDTSGKAASQVGAKAGSSLLVLGLLDALLPASKGVNTFVTNSSIVQPRLRGRAGPNPCFSV